MICCATHPIDGTRCVVDHCRPCPHRSTRGPWVEGETAIDLLEARLAGWRAGYGGELVFSIDVSEGRRYEWSEGRREGAVERLRAASSRFASAT